jgi:hypothetical protein
MNTKILINPLPRIGLIALLIVVGSLLGLDAECLASATNIEDQLVFDVTKHEKGFLLTASFALPLSQCQSYRLLTDYDSVEDIPGFVYSNTERIGTNKVRVERMIEEKILFVPIDVRTTIEFTENPYIGTDFKQVQGKAKVYQGSWRLESEGSKSTRFNYRAQIEPGSFVPSFLIQHFISKKLRRNFEALINIGIERQNTAIAPCN